MLKEKKLYAVTAKCGHVRRNYYVPVTFAIEASSGVEAAAIARLKERVKHDHKDAILALREVDIREFNHIKRMNNMDPYLLCKNPQQQKLIFDEIKDRLVVDSHNQKIEHSIEERYQRVGFKRRKAKLVEDEMLEYAYSDAC